MTPEATVAAYKAELKKQQEAAEVARVAQVARVAALQREKETAEIARLEAAWPMAFTKPSPSDIIPNYASSPTVYTAPSPVYTYTRPEYDFLAEFNSENRRREQEAQTLRFFEEGRRATYGGWM